MKPDTTYNPLFRRLSGVLLLIWSFMFLASLPGIYEYAQGTYTYETVALPAQADADTDADSSTAPVHVVQAPVQAFISPVAQLPAFYPEAQARVDVPEVAEEERLHFDVPALFGKLARTLFRTLISPNAP